MKKLLGAILILIASNAIYAADVLIMEERVITRTKGKPSTKEISFNSSVTEGRLLLQLGEVTSGQVLLNGVKILSEKDFKRSTGYLEINVPLNTENNLSVTIKGKPSSEIRIEAFGKDENIREHTMVINEGLTETIISADPNIGTITFDNSNSQAANLVIGNLVVMSITEHSPFGFIGEVTDINHTSDTIVVNTKPASILKAIKHLSFEASLVDEVPKTKAQNASQLAATSEPQQTATITLVDESFDKLLLGTDDDAENSVRLKGNATVSGSANVVVEADGGSLERFSLTYGLTQDYSIDLIAHAAYRGEINHQFYNKKPKPKVKFVGLFPIVYSFETIGTLKGEASIEGTLTSGIKYNRYMSGGIYCFPRGASINCGPRNSGAVTDFERIMEISASANAKVGVEGQLTVSFYQLAGPYLTLQPYIEAESDLTGWGLYAGLDSYIGIEFNDVLKSEIGGTFLEEPYQLFDIRKLLINGEWFDSPPPPPPSGDNEFEVWGANHMFSGAYAFEPHKQGYEHILTWSIGGNGGHFIPRNHRYYVIITRGKAELAIDAFADIRTEANIIQYIGGKNINCADNLTEMDGYPAILGDGNNGGYILIDNYANKSEGFMFKFIDTEFAKTLCLPAN